MLSMVTSKINAGEKKISTAYEEDIVLTRKMPL